MRPIYGVIWHQKEPHTATTSGTLLKELKFTINTDAK